MLGRNPEGKKRLVNIGAKPRKKKNAKLQQQTLRFKHHGATPREEKKVWRSIKELTRNTKQRPQESVRKLASQVYLEKKKKAGAHAADPIFSKIARAYECAHKGRIINSLIGIRKLAFLTHPHIHRYQRKMNSNTIQIKIQIQIQKCTTTTKCWRINNISCLAI